MPNLYADAGQFARRFANDATLDTPDLTEVLTVIEAASRAIDDYCDRHFYAVTATRVFDGDGYTSMWIPDLISATTVKLDEDEDGTFETTLTASDYRLVRSGHWDQDATPKTKIELLASGAIGAFQPTDRLLQIVGSWGYTADTETTADTVENNPLTDTGTTLTVNDGTNFDVGQTLLIESEQVYVTAISTNNLTVVRGMNGTTAAAHVQNTAITRFVYVPEVVEATVAQAGRIWKRRETAYANVIQNPLTGAMEQFKGVDPDIQMILSTMRRLVPV